jgi:hypothetical protein
VTRQAESAAGGSEEDLTHVTVSNEVVANSCRLYFDILIQGQETDIEPSLEQRTRKVTRLMRCMDMLASYQDVTLRSQLCTK